MEEKNKDLKGQQGLSVDEGPVLPFEKPIEFKHIPDDVIELVDRYMKVAMSTDANKNRKVEVREIINNTKYMFSEEARRKDKFWIQHCASTFREIIMFIEPQHYHETMQSIPSPTDPRINPMLSFLERATSYLSHVVHFRDNKRVGLAEKLYPNNGYGQKDKTEFIKDEHKLLERLCIDIIYTLHSLFTRYCKNNGSN